MQSPRAFVHFRENPHLICKTTWTEKLRNLWCYLLPVQVHKRYLFISFILGVANQSDELLYVMTEKNLSKAGTASNRVYIM